MNNRCILGIFMILLGFGCDFRGDPPEVEGHHLTTHCELHVVMVPDSLVPHLFLWPQPQITGAYQGFKILYFCFDHNTGKIEVKDWVEYAQGNEFDFIISDTVGGDTVHVNSDYQGNFAGAYFNPPPGFLQQNTIRVSFDGQFFHAWELDQSGGFNDWRIR